MLTFLGRINENRIYDKLLKFTLIFSAFLHIILISAIRNFDFVEVNLPIDLSPLLENPVSAKTESFNLLNSSGIELITIKMIGGGLVESRGSTESENSGNADEKGTLNSSAQNKNTDITKSLHKSDEMRKQIEEFAENYDLSLEGEVEDILDQLVVNNKGSPGITSRKSKNYKNRLSVIPIGAFSHPEKWMGHPYLLKIKNTVHENWTSRLNEDDGLEGYIEVRFQITPEGRMRGFNIVNFEGDGKLRTLLVDAVKGTFPFFPLPPEFPQKNLGIRIYITVVTGGDKGGIIF